MTWSSSRTLWSTRASGITSEARLRHQPQPFWEPHYRVAGGLGGFVQILRARSVGMFYVGVLTIKWGAICCRFWSLVRLVVGYHAKCACMPARLLSAWLVPEAWSMCLHACSPVVRLASA